MAKAEVDSPFKLFRQLARKLVAVPKNEIQQKKVLRVQRKPPAPKVS